MPRKKRVSFSEFRRKERAASYGVEEDFSPYMRGRVRKQFGRRCFRCGATRRRLHIDHHRPLCLGNPLEYGNAVVLCKKCNLEKGAKPPEDFYTQAELRRLEPYLEEQRAWAKRKKRK